jgi:hypothetical protein
MDVTEFFTNGLPVGYRVPNGAMNLAAGFHAQNFQLNGDAQGAGFLVSVMDVFIPGE